MTANVLSKSSENSFEHRTNIQVSYFDIIKDGILVDIVINSINMINLYIYIGIRSRVHLGAQLLLL